MATKFEEFLEKRKKTSTTEELERIQKETSYLSGFQLPSEEVKENLTVDEKKSIFSG